MRTSCLVLSLYLSLVHAAAQEGLQFGARVIPTWSWFMNEDDEGVATSGMCYGAGVNYHWADGIGAGIDLIWGSETQSLSDGAGGEWTLERSVFKMPVLLHFNSQAEDVVPFLGYVGIERVAVREVAVTGPGGIDPENMPLTGANGQVTGSFRSDELYRSSDFGALIGFGPGWNINERLQFTAIVRAEYLFNDPEDKDSDTGAVFWNGRERTTLATLGIDLGLKFIIGR